MWMPRSPTLASKCQKNKCILYFCSMCQWESSSRSDLWIQHTSFSSSVYSLTLSTATILVSSSEVIRTSQLRVWVTCKAQIERERESTFYILHRLIYYHNHQNHCYSHQCHWYHPIAGCLMWVYWWTNVKSVRYWQANQATVQRVSGNNSKQSRKKHHQVSQELKTDGQPPVQLTRRNTHTELEVPSFTSTLKTHQKKNVTGFAVIWPVWHYPWVDALKVFVDSYFIVLEKSFLMAVCSDHWQTRNCLSKVRVYGRARHRVQPTQLSWSGYIETLGKERATRQRSMETGWSLIFTVLILICMIVFSCLVHLYKVVDQGQRNDDNGEERSSQTDDKQCPQYTQQTQEPGAEGLRNGFIYCENVLKKQY